MRKSGITLRWLLTTILVIALVLLFITVSATLILKDYYYTSVQSKLESMGISSSLSDYFGSYIDASEDRFSARAREYVDNFSEKNNAEVWIIDRSGEVIVTSVGFISDRDDAPDYENALDSPSGGAIWCGKLSSGEKVMAYTSLLPRSNGHSNGAVRYIISLELIDSQLLFFSFLISCFCLFSLLLVIVSGMFFVRSIVNPVNKLNIAARKIAAGNYSEKVEVENRYDEIAELSNSINYMTDEIAKSDRLKNEFISTISHELRTPLTAIKGWTETLLCINENTDKTIDDGLKVILNETERLYSLVEDLLDFSKIESGRMTLRLKKIDIIAELDDAVYVLKDRASREGLKIFYNSPVCTVVVNGDPNRIKQVFVNLIDNAIKYTNAGGSITVVVTPGDKDVTVTVSDTGCGIAPEDIPRVKEKFFKANSSVKGSGIGLAVCDEIIKLHKGDLDITSKLGVGTQVSVRLPVESISYPDRKD